MTAAEVRTLATDGLVDIGSHGVTHSALAALAPPSQDLEIARGKADLEDIIGRTVTSFAYPFGRRIDYTAETASLVRAAGFTRACSATGEGPGRLVNRYEIPRVHVPDMDSTAFEPWLSKWFDA
jgi:peptidoglycan/xylan/chitin deacetylase (PgdA/CDA1 family)